MRPKIATVTGGNRGLGKSAVLHLARRGVDAIFTYRSTPPKPRRWRTRRGVPGRTRRAQARMVWSRLPTGKTESRSITARSWPTPCRR